jgi:intein/homing endonuclease
MSDEIFFDGVRYISASDAAASSGLTRDYIARLCRDEKVRGRRVGKNWYAADASFKSFLVSQEYGKSLRKESLSRERVQEYHGALKASAAVAAVPARAEKRVDGIKNKVTSAVVAQTSKAAEQMKTLAQVPSGITNAALSAHVPLYTVTPLMEFVHKLIALTLAFMLTFGTYALVDPQYARFAADSIQAQADAVRDSGSNLSAFADRAQTRLAAAAIDPRGAASNAVAAASVAFATGIPGMFNAFASAFNARVNDLVYAVAFPPDLVRSIGSAGGSGSVAVQIVPYSNTASSSIRGVASTQRPAGSTAIISNPVIEHDIETQRIVAEGGISEDELNQKLQELDNKFSAQLFSITAPQSSAPSIQNAYAEVAQTNAIDQLTGTAIKNPAITGGSITGTDISANSLSVGGQSVLSDTTVNGSLNVLGSVDLQNIFLASSTLSITASPTQTSNLIQVLDASGTPLFAVEPDGTLLTTNASSTQIYTSLLIAGGATTTSLYASALGALTATSTYFTAENATTTNAVLVNATATNLSAQNASTTNLIWENATGTNAVITNATTTNFFSTNASTTNATSTNLFSVVGNFTTGIISTLNAAVATIADLTATNLVATNASTTNATTTNQYVSNLSAATASTTNLTFQTAVGANATTTNLFSATASSTNLFGANLAAGIVTLGNATSTNLFSATASSTNLFAQAASLGSLALASGTSTDFFATTASSTNLFAANGAVGALSAGTLNLVGLGTFANGFVSQASSTIGNGNQNGGLTISGGATTTGNAYFGGEVFAQNGLRVSSSAGDDTNNAPWYGIGQSNVTLAGAGAGNRTVQVAGYYGIQFVTAGNAISFNEAGDLGIGNASPTYALDVNGAGHFTQFVDASYFVATSSGATSLFNGNVQVNGNTTLASATTTNLFSTTASSTNLFSQTASLGSLSLASALPVSSGGTGAQSFGQGWVYSNGGTGALAASTSPTVNYVTATSTTATSLFEGNLTVNGSTQLVSLAASGNTALANATSTNLFSVTASSTNLFAQTASLGGLTSDSLTLPNISNSLLYASGNEVAAASVGSSLAFSTGTLSLNTANPNTFSALQQFANATSTEFSATQKAYFGTSGQSSFDFNGALSLGTPLAQTSGGTGITSYNAGDILYADNSGTLQRLPVGSTGSILQVQAGLPGWGAAPSGGSSGANEVWATTTNDLVIYPTNTARSVVVGSNATSTLNSIFEVHGNQYVSGNVGIASTSPSTTLGVNGSGYFTGGLGVGVLNTLAGSLQTSGNATVGGILLLPALSTGSLLYNNGFNQVAAAGVSYPLQFSSGSLSLAFGTTTANAWSQVQTFASGFVSQASSTVNGAFTATGAAVLGSTLNVAGNTTLANATTTNLFSTTASSTNLFSANGTVGVLSAGTLNLASTLNVSGLSTFAGFISTASSTIGDGTQAGGLTVSGGATTTGNAYFGGKVTQTGGTVAFSPSSSLTGFTVDGTTLNVDSTNHRVGIGTASPIGSLEVHTNSGQVFVANTIGSSALNEFGIAGSANDFVTGSAANDAVFKFSGSNFLFVNSAVNGGGAVERMRLTSAGNLGIGTTNPGSKLEVQGLASAQYFNATSSANTSQLSGGLIVSGTTTLANATTTNLFSTTASSTNLFSANGSVGVLSAGTLNLTGLGTFANGFVSQASSTVNGAFTATGAATFGNTVTFSTLCVTADTKLRRRRRRTDIFGDDDGDLETENTALASGVPSTPRAAERCGTGPDTPSSIDASTWKSSENAGSVENASEAGGGTRTLGTWSVKSCPAPYRQHREVYHQGKRYLVDDTYVYDEVAIIDIEEGDEIQSLDEKTGRLVWSRVKNLFFMGTKQTYRITTEDGREIRTTSNHPYLVKNAKGKSIKHRSPIIGAGWAAVSQLKEGDEIAVAKATFQMEKTALASGLFQLPWATKFDKPGTSYARSVADRTWMSSEDGRGVENISVQPVVGVGPTARGIRSPGRNQSTGLPAFYHELQMKNSLYGELRRTIGWAKIVSIEAVAEEDVYDIEVEGTHNFIAGGIVAHNTAIFNSTGLGIGTLNPGSKLEVQGLASAQYFNATSSTNFSTFTGGFVSQASSTIGSGTQAGGLTISGGATTTGNAYFGGNVGIGTASPGYNLEVSGTGYFSAQLGVQGNLDMGAGASAARTIGRVKQISNDQTTGLAIQSSNTSGYINFFTGGNAAGNERVRIGSTGNVGIGTTVPNFTLEVQGTASTTNLFATNATTTNLFSTTASSTNLFSQFAQLGFATTTTLFSSTASSTNLYAQSANFGTLGLSGLGTFANGFVSQASSTVAGAFTATGAATFGNTVTFSTLCVAADTRLRRRRKARKGEEGEADEDGYIYDEPMIKDIEEGDEIQSLDQKTGTFTWSRVNGLIDTGIQPLIKLTTLSGRSIRTTAAHPYLVRTEAYRDKKLHVPQKLMRFEVDQSIRFEEYQRDTVVALANAERSITVVIPRSVKRAMREAWNKRPARLAPNAFASAIVFAMKNAGIIVHQLVIDTEYASHEKEITAVVSGAFPGIQVDFVEVGKKSPAHIAAYRVFKALVAPSLTVVSSAGKEKTENAPRAFQYTASRAHRNPTRTPLIPYKIDNQDEFVKKGRWTVAGTLCEGQYIAVAHGNTPAWERIVKIEHMPEERVYDIEIEGTHNFIAGGIVAHNTAIFNSTGLGIGTLNPGSKLEVQGLASAQYFNATSSTNFSTFTGGFVSQASSTIGSGTQAGGLTISGGATTTGNAYFAGNVGIGTTNPNFKLEVQGTASTTNLFATNATTTNLFSTTASSTNLFSQTASLGSLSLGSALPVSSGGTGLTSTSQNFFFAGPTSGSGAPAWRAIVAGDIPTLNQNTTGSAATLTTARTIAGVSFNGSANIAIPSTGLSDTANIAYLNAANAFTNTGNTTFAGNVGIGTTNPNFKLEVQGTASTTNLFATNATTTNLFSTTASSTNLFSQTASLGSLSLGSALPVSSGGTGLTSTSQNFFFAGPTSGSGAPAWRAIVAGDIPTLNQNTTGSAATLTTARTIAGVSFNGSANIAIPSTGLSDTANIAYLNAANAFTNTGNNTFAGNVGIGTSTPFANLSVQTATNDTALQVANAAGAPTFQVSTVNTSNNIFEVASSTGSAYFDITSGGNVGIGTSSPLSTFAVVGSACFSKGGSATAACGTTAGDAYGTAFNTGAYDVAENYLTSDASVTPGTIVALDGVNPEEVATATSSADVLGVVSTNPGLILGGADASIVGEKTVPIALSGRVPVKISFGNGPINAGDRLALSTTTPGVAVKSLVTGETIGMALETATSSSSLIDVFVQPQFIVVPDAGLASTTATSTPAAVASSFFGGASATLRQEITSLGSAVVRVFQTAVYAATGIFNKVYAQEVHTDKLCVSDSGGETCITRSQLNALLAGQTASAAASGSAGSGGASSSGNSGSSSSATSTPPVIQVNGDDPATIQVGAAYNDLGASITSPQTDLNLGISVSVDGGATTTPDKITLDTSVAGTHTISYSATDQNGLVGTATRTVNVVAVSSSDSGNDASSTDGTDASSTNATSTNQ